MRRLHCDPLPASGGLVTLDAAARRHALVLRLAVGDSLVLFDGHGHEADARIESISPDLCCTVDPARTGADVRRVVLVQCLAKGDKLDEIVRAVTEAGVAEIRLAKATRDVAKWDVKKEKLERLERIAREAARQSGRADVPTLFSPLPLTDVTVLAPKDAERIVLVPGARISLPSLLSEGGFRRETWLVVGSEGGLDEILDGWTPASLGPYVLRVEHAGLVAVAIAVGA